MGASSPELADLQTVRWPVFVLAAAGAVAVGLALLMTPEFAVRHQAIRNELTPERLGRLAGLRLGAGFLGIGLMAAAVQWRRITDWLPRASTRCGLPLGRMLAVLGGFAVLFVGNLALQIAGLVRHTARLFPVSVVRAPEIHWTGLPWLALFLTVAWLAVRRRHALGVGRAWAIGTLLLVLGNLGQGGLEAGFALPFTDPRGGPPPGIQYYHEALGVSDATAWLGGFNASQEQLSDHARTHPPFAVLIHRGLLVATGESVLALALVFVLLASLALPLAAAVARRAGCPPQRAAELALLLAVLPAFNVYAAVSLDGVVLTTSALALWGLLLARAGRPAAGAAIFTAGLLTTQALTFGGAWLAAAAGLLGLVDLWRERRPAALVALAVALLALTACAGLLHAAFGYDHWTAFLTASRLENPHGFRGLVQPLQYLMTRIEGVAEIALFLSVPALGVLASTTHRGPLALDLRGDPGRVILAGVGALAAMMLAGAWCTGETARACLFISPVLLLAFSAVPKERFGPLLLAVAIQTALMQGFANFFW
jgi:hypothetical protein